MEPVTDQKELEECEGLLVFLKTLPLQDTPPGVCSQCYPPALPPHPRLCLPSLSSGPLGLTRQELVSARPGWGPAGLGSGLSIRSQFLSAPCPHGT